MGATERKQLVALLQRIVSAQDIGSGVHPGLAARPAESPDPA